MSSLHRVKVDEAHSTLNENTSNGGVLIADIAIPSSDNLVQVPTLKAAVLSKFPPGCPVLFTNNSGSLVVSRGLVDAVFVDLTPDSSRDYFYKVSLDYGGGSTTAAETQLQWAPQCPVWLNPPQETTRRSARTELEWKRAVIRGSYQDGANADPQYSVQEVEPVGGIFHGVTKDCVRYRRKADAPLTIKTDPDRVVEQAEPAKEDPVAGPPVAGFTSAFDSPTSVVNDSLLDSNPPTNVKRVARPTPLPRTPTVAAARQTACEASARPSSSENHARSVAHSQRVDSSAAPSVTPQRRSSPRPRAAARAATHPTEGSARFTSESTVTAQKRSIPSGNLDTKGTAARGESADQQAPPPKKAKATESDSKVLSKTGHTPLTSEMLLQKSKSIAADILCDPPRPTRRNSDLSQSSSSISASPMLLKSSGLADPAKQDAAGTGVDQSDLCTLTIRIPKFANPDVIAGVIIGDGGCNHKRLLRETGCKRIELKGHHPNHNLGKHREPMEVILKGPASTLESAQLHIEDSIVDTVPDDQRGRMLYYLAKENNYGASEGLARYQRSPRDSREWLWMAAIGVPTDFPKFQALFVSTRGRALAEISRQSGCRKIAIINSRPQYIFVVGHTMESVNVAADLLKARVHWASDMDRNRDRR